MTPYLVEWHRIPGMDNDTAALVNRTGEHWPRHKARARSRRSGRSRQRRQERNR